jgi:hypothetical protein
VSPALLANALNYSAWVDEKVFTRLKKIAPGQGIGYPAVIWKTADGVHVMFGYTSHMEEIANSVVARPEAASVQPRDAQLLKMQFQREPGSEHYYAKSDGAKGYALPDEGSPVLTTFDKDTGNEVVSRVQVNGQAWIEEVWWDDVRNRGVFFREQDLRQGEGAPSSRIVRAYRK